MLLIDTCPIVQRRNKRFMFDRRWLQFGEVGKVVEEGCQKPVHATKLFEVACKIKNVRISLLNWNKTLKINSAIRIKELKEKIKKVKESSIQNKGVSWPL
ncbi:hypothetical protein ACH5RR_018418 [Cinchona calisaya]|uniref:Uncharacterized protein n=1 Tax=Cinchona calisaya TaxID=153742 RepID=A0ABD2ZLY0_9GENT